MVTRLCSIEECNRPVKALGWCGGHYVRWSRHGTPTGGKALKGDGVRFINSLLGKDIEECIQWPFATAADGRGRLCFEGRDELAHRVVCRLTHGLPPTPKHLAAHSCGNGRLGCVNPNHIRWATPQENIDDMLAHGTRQYGEDTSSAVLTLAEVHEIRASFGCSQRKLAAKFGVSKTTVRKILTGETWGTFPW